MKPLCDCVHRDTAQLGLFLITIATRASLLFLLAAVGCYCWIVDKFEREKRLSTKMNVYKITLMQMQTRLSANTSSSFLYI